MATLNMSGLLFSLQPECITCGVSTKLKLGISHGFDETLHNLTMRAQSTSQVQLMGSPRLRVEQIGDGSTVWVELPVHARQTGKAWIKLDRLTARLGGKTMEFPDVSLSMEVHPLAVFPLDVLTLTCKTTTIEESAQQTLTLHVRNDSEFFLREVVLHLQAFDFELASDLIKVGELVPYASADVNVSLVPQAAGDLHLAVMLRAQRDGDPVECNFDLPFKVRKDQRRKETHYHGNVTSEVNVIQIGKGDKTTGAISEDRNNPDKSYDRRPRSSLVVSNEQTTVKIRTCPECGSDVPFDRFCDRCGFEFSRPD